MISDAALSLDPGPDVHPADVVAALRKRGTSLAQVARKHGYHPNGLSMVFSQFWPNAEWLISLELSRPDQPVRPWELWPSRWVRDGRGRMVPKQGQVTGRITPLLPRDRKQRPADRRHGRDRRGTRRLGTTE